jgi:hypothetical protein
VNRRAERENKGGGGRPYLHPCAAVLEPVYAWSRHETEVYVCTAVVALCVGGLDAELVRVGPGGPAGGTLVVREPGEEPGVRAVLIVDLERDKQASAERDGGKQRSAAENGDANSDALYFQRSVCRFIASKDNCSPSSRSPLGSKGFAGR